MLGAGGVIFMRIVYARVVALSLLLAGSGTVLDRTAEGLSSACASDEAGQTTSSVRTPVIVELFTSEGCSSCPPADALLAKLEEQQPIASVEIIALEEHVDYWNGQGWSDPFSSGGWTWRQEAYATSFRSGSVYTPQMVIDGRNELIGSRGHSVLEAIKTAAEQTTAQALITPTGRDGNKEERFSARVEELTGTTAGDTPEVWLAVTETGLHTAVLGGENAGQDLHHAAVVRILRKAGVADRSKEPAFAGETTVKIASGWKRQNLRAVVLVQEKNSRRILAAASARFE